MDSHYIILSLFAVAAYFIVTDDSVAAAFFYVTRLVKAYIQRQLWWLTHNPRNPVVKYMMWRRSMKLAQELMDEYKNK
jgi:uncharacterized membrane protein YpjA